MVVNEGKQKGNKCRPHPSIWRHTVAHKIGPSMFCTMALTAAPQRPMQMKKATVWHLPKKCIVKKLHTSVTRALPSTVNKWRLLYYVWDFRFTEFACIKLVFYQFYRSIIKFGIITDDWRILLATAIHMKEVRADTVNSRQINLTLIACKVLNRVIREQIISHLKQ